MKCQPGCTCGRHRTGPRSDEIRAKISATKMGHAVTPEARAKIGAAFRGRKQTPEAVAARAAAITRHGHASSRSPEYRAWDGMRQRCLNPKSSRYATYGGAGITVCERWSSFETFLADMGEKPEPKSAYSLDRRDGALGYSPSNCRWATASEQQRNRPNFRPDKRSKH